MSGWDPSSKLCFPWVVMSCYVVLPRDAMGWQWWQQVWGGWNVNNWGAPGWAGLSSVSSSPHCHLVSPSPQLAVTNKESPGRWTLLDAAHYIFLSRSERSTLQPVSKTKKPDDPRCTGTQLCSIQINYSWLELKVEIFCFSLNWFLFQLFSIICAVLNGLQQMMMFSVAIIVI